MTTAIQTALEKVNASFAEFTTLLAKVNAAAASVPVDPSNVVVSKKPAPTKVVDEETGEVVLNRDEVESLGIVDLRKLAKSHGVEEKKKADILSAFEEKGFFAESEEDEDEDEEAEDLTDEADDEDDEEEDDDEGSDEEDEDGYTREDLEELDLRELKKLAKEEGHTQADIKGLDQEGLIDLILGEEDEDEDEEDEEDDDEADDDEDDEDEVVIDKETLEEMSDAELKEIVKQFSIKLPKGAKRKTIIQTILDAAEDDDDE